ncbi:fructose-bisphosphate aldolase [Sphingomonas sp. AR_OL41]|uniref:class I fructose-bisphosphate aldolase n=1 Tax=Sphingomonas sp. AR_OL41 TaxID=3042729 RepID=UPI00248086F5|nr:class I fructose-bisphosphate aldolase [Sphingomonas sp. AR_OL41]MDH7972841.1 fructose-bisphosphate aldolase [Sphingomonas sp. AR_OL41]
MTDDAALLAQVRSGAGLFAALDQSGGSTAGALEAYGISRDGWSGDEEMFTRIHEMRARIMTVPSFDGRRVLAAILFERTMTGRVAGQPVPAYLRRRGVATFLKIDAGLEPEIDGVQLMKPIDGLVQRLDRARALGVIGTKMRSVIRIADRAGIASLVDQQFELADTIIARGLMPILEPEVSIDANDRAMAERYLLDRMTTRLNALTGDQQLILKLTIPAESDRYVSLIGHHRVARVLALSGGLSRREACSRLSRNHGVIASFSRALLEDLRHGMDDATFDRALGSAIEQIYLASTTKR